MNWSLVLVAEVPLAVTTVTCTVPAPAGDVTVRLVSLFTVSECPRWRRSRRRWPR